MFLSFSSELQDLVFNTHSGMLACFQLTLTDTIVYLVHAFYTRRRLNFRKVTIQCGDVVLQVQVRRRGGHSDDSYWNAVTSMRALTGGHKCGGIEE